MPAPTYLVRDRHGGYLFSITVPMAVRSLLNGKKTIRQSLRTQHRPTAIKRARALAVQALDLFELLEMKKNDLEMVKLW